MSSLAELSLKRPIFVTCLAIATMAVGVLCLMRLGVDMLPNVTFPIVTVSVPYPGAAPAEIETLVSKVLEDEISNVQGIKTLKSISREGVSVIIASFTLETDIKYAEQQVRDRVASAKRKMPTDIDEPTIRKIAPSDQPVLFIGLHADLPPGEIYDVANEVVKPRLAQISDVGLVDVVGGRKREIQVVLDRTKLKQHEMSASLVANRLRATGMNIPLGKVNNSQNETVLRAIGEFKSVEEIEHANINFFANDVPVAVKDLGTVKDTLKDETSRTFVDGKQGLFILVFRQTGANTVKVSNAVKAAVAKINTDLANQKGHPRLEVIRDSAKFVRLNLEDVTESIALGILLTIIVVFLFLGSWRSTIITGLAIPNSLLGAFILMSVAGFTINSMTLLAMSLAVGLLVDDAIVVRENIFRYMEMGKKPVDAAIIGTKEVTLAVIGTTLAVLAVFGPVGFLKGVVGQFFREFAFTICFAMVISLYDALTIAPMLSAYFAVHTDKKPSALYRWTIGLPVTGFEHVQRAIERMYSKVLRFSLRFPALVFIFTFAVVGSCVYLLKFVPKTFLSPQDFGEFAVSLELPPGTSLQETARVALEVEATLRKNPEIAQSTTIVGNADGQSNVADFNYVLVSRDKRNVNTSQFKDRVRQLLVPFAYANPKVKDQDFIGVGARPFSVNIVGSDWAVLEPTAHKLFKYLETHPGLTDVEYGSKAGKPEFQVVIDSQKAASLGVSSSMVGNELRTQVDGTVAALFRQNGREYDIRVRLQDDQRDLERNFDSTYVPNINGSLLAIKNVAKGVKTEGPSEINRQDRNRYIYIGADIKAGGPGMGAVMADIKTLFTVKEPLPQGMTYGYSGQADSFQEMIESLATAFGLAIIFTFLVLASLYESFVTPFTIMLVLPLALCGAFAALFIGKASLDINSMIGCILLLGLATKNSILLVDYAHQLVRDGVDRKEAMYQAGMTRLRPILMTTMALIAGTLPIAIGLNEASKQRTSMGIAVIGGLISSSLLTLIVVPAAYSYIDRFRAWSASTLKKIFIPDT